MESTSKRFLIRRSDLTTRKLFVEFYLPESQALMETLHGGAYEVRSLREIAKRIFDGPFGSDRTIDMYQDSGIPYIRVKDVLPGMIARDGLTYISPEKHQLLSRCRVVPGNVLLTIAGRLGTAAVFPEDLVEGNITGHIAGIEPKDDVNSDYLALYLNSRFGESQFTRWGHRTTRPELNLGEVGEILVVVPPLDIQDCIAQVMQDAYAARRAKLAEAEQLVGNIEESVLNALGIETKSLADKPRFMVRQSHLHRLDVRFFSPLYEGLESAIQSGRYKTSPLGAICTKLTNGLTPARLGYTSDGYAVIKVGSLTRDWRVDWDAVAFTSETFFKKAKKALVQDGDLLILSASHQLDYIGRNFALVNSMPAKYTQRCITVGELIIARTKRDVMLPEFLLACFAMQPIQQLVNRMTRGQSAHLYAEDLKNLQIPTPPLRIQQTIVDDIEKRRADARQLRSEAETLITEAKARVERMILGEERVP